MPTITSSRSAVVVEKLASPDCFPTRVYASMNNKGKMAPATKVEGRRMFQLLQEQTGRVQQLS